MYCLICIFPFLILISKLARVLDQCVNGKCIIANVAMVNAVTGLTGQMYTTDYRPHPVMARCLSHTNNAV